MSAAWLGAAGTAAAVELPAGWLEATVDERGQRCVKQGEHADGQRLLLACGAAGVWEIVLEESGPRLIRSYQFEGPVTGFFVEAGGRVWVKFQVEQARPLDGAVTAPLAPAAPAPLPAPTAPPKAPAPAAPRATPPAPLAERRIGRVVSESPGQVVISLGAADGISRSDRIELSLEQREEWVAGDTAVSREALAVGVVVNVTEHHAKVRLGIDERVPVGALAIPTRMAVTASLSAPPRVGDVWELELMARPFAAIGELGGGVLLNAAISRRLATNFRFGAALEPLAIADVEMRESVGAAHGALTASYDSQYLEVGVGVGAQTVNETSLAVKPGSGLNLVQLVRFGAEDGLNLSLRTSVVLFHQEFEFGGMVGGAQIPVTRGYWLVLGGGGGTVGYAYGELGLRVLMTGNGHAGSAFLTTTAGGAAVFRSAICDEIEFSFECEQGLTYGGPMVGVGGEWRF